jgi:thiamine pyrophosphate-dependent acetolactate synthase large subunit-like protein
MNVSDFLLKRLRAWGVRVIYGFPGDGINGIMGAFNRNDHGIRFIQARHEEMAAFMACAHAKFTGEVGVCLATSGPGAIHLLNGLYDAKMDHAPVVAIVGQSARSALGGNYQQELDLQSLFKDVAHEYVHTCMTAESAGTLLDRALRIAKSQRTVTCMIVPKDVQELDAVLETPHEHDMVPTSLDYADPRVTPPVAQLRRAADLLRLREALLDERADEPGRTQGDRGRVPGVLVLARGRLSAQRSKGRGAHAIRALAGTSERRGPLVRRVRRAAAAFGRQLPAIFFARCSDQQRAQSLR